MKFEYEGRPEDDISPVEKRVEEVRRSAMLAGKDPDEAEKKLRAGLLEERQKEEQRKNKRGLENAA